MGATERKKTFSEIRLLTDRTEIAYETLRISHALETFDMSDLHERIRSRLDL